MPRTSSGAKAVKSGKPRPSGPPRRPPPSRGPEALARYERARTSIMVGSAVRAARRRAGVSQVELAERAGTSQPSIARLEKGLVSPTVITLDRIGRRSRDRLRTSVRAAPQQVIGQPQHQSGWARRKGERAIHY